MVLRGITLSLSCLLLAWLCTACERDAVIEQAIEYTDGDTVLEGFLYYQEGQRAAQPGVLVVHEWTGLGDYAKSRARQLAERGIVAFAADMYGKGVYGKTHEEAAALSKPLREDRQAMRQRLQAAYDVLMRNSRVDDSRMAAIGFCFGGTAALELARHGSPLKAAVSFHGGLSTPDLTDAENIEGEVLVLHGADDPRIPAEDVGTFIREMQTAGVRYALHAYPGAVHSFTVPTAGGDPSRGSAYNKEAAERAWDEMLRLFDKSL